AFNDAPDNSIFFISKNDRGIENIQRLSFSDIYLLDREASQEQKNLLLLYQGAQGFANKVFKIEERAPRVGLAVVHQVLGFNDPDETRLTHVGAEESLDTRNFSTLDIILKKWGGGPPEPVVMTFNENRFERLERQIRAL